MTFPCNCAVRFVSTGVPHQLKAAAIGEKPPARALVPLFWMTELVRVKTAVSACHAPMALAVNNALPVARAAPFCSPMP